MVEMDKDAATEKQSAMAQKVKYVTPFRPRNSTLTYIPQRTENRNQTDICILMFTASLFTGAKRWK